MAQIVTTLTWSRTVNGVQRESLTNHIYVANPTVTSELCSVKPLFGEHLLLICSVDSNKSKELTSNRRSCQKYLKAVLFEMLENENCNEDCNEDCNEESETV
jgi:hypothetical protein